MSSAILYLAIVAIWACVLIPRWLRRGGSGAADTAVPGEVPGDVIPGDVVPGGGGSGEDDSGETVASDAVRPGDPGQARDAAHAGALLADKGDDAPAPLPLTRDESRQRMLAARRRLLGMLLALEVAAIALAVLGLAALWVVIPPSVMLAGYLLLLREAAHADAEQAQREQEAARAQARGRIRAGQPAPAVPASYEDSGPGRDFAPGLAGKYTTSNAEVIDISEHADDDRYEQYAGSKLRAVGH